MVYNCRDDTRLGVDLIGVDSSVKVARLMLLTFAALAAVVLAGCGGSGGNSESSAERQAPRTSDSSEQKPGNTNRSEPASGGKLGHPALGSANAPVVLTEFGDYQ